MPDSDEPIAARARRDALKHTLGNLTLVTGKLNPKMSNGPWAEKREALATYSVMRISTDIREATVWDEATIAARSEQLARLATAIWGRPDDTLEVPVADPPPAVAPEMNQAGAELADSGLPADLVQLIALRASPAASELAIDFARQALALDGVELRVQRSKGDPWYFQVRHPRFSQVVAYAHPRPAELHIEFRLPSTNETYDTAQSRDHYYGIVLKVRQFDDVVVARRLLQDALARPT